MMPTQRDLSTLQERILQVFLRLCGYFPVNFLLHCEPGRGTLAGEVDVLAVRFPFHRELGTGNALPEWLEIPSDRVDLLVCEAKLQRRAFNASVRSPEALATVIRRFGAVPEQELQTLPEIIAAQLEPASFTRSQTFVRADMAGDAAQLRFLVFCGQAARNIRGPFIYADEVLAYIHGCLAINQAPPTCARVYATENWAPDDGMVRTLKSRAWLTPPGSIETLWRRMHTPSHVAT